MINVTKNYKYTVNIGAPREYDMLYDFNQNYLMDQQGKPLLYFTAVGGSPGQNWPNGQQATLLSEQNPLPHGIKIRWFSVAENQFWEGTYQFDQSFLEQLSHLQVNYIFHQTTYSFMDYFTFMVYVVPGGLATVWVAGGGETYLLAQFQAYKVEQKDWQVFADGVLQRQICPGNMGNPSREDYIKERFSDAASPMSTITKQQLAEGKLPTDSAPWKRLMRIYPWQLTTNDEYKLTDYWAWYVNGEQRFIYSTDNPMLLAPRAVPCFVSFYVEDNQTKKLNRFNIIFDKEEIMREFETLTKTASIEEAIHLHLNIDIDQQMLDIFLIKGSTSIELKNFKASLENLYTGDNAQRMVNVN